MKTALITGLTGQDGSYLAEFLLSKGYRVVGLVRRSSSFNTSRIDHLINVADNFFWERADLQDAVSINNILVKYRPDEIYHLAAQSHVSVSFDVAEYTMEVGVLGTLRLLEALRTNRMNPKVYNAGSSEMFGSAPAPQNEATKFIPQSPYAIAKVAAHQLMQLYRSAYSMQLYNGILFNHESPRRGETFVTRKVTRALAKIYFGTQAKLRLGNLDSVRDWGFSGDYVEAMWLMLQKGEPDDYVIATGESLTVREFVASAFKEVGIVLRWQGEAMNEEGVVSHFIDVPGLISQRSAGIEVGDVLVEVGEEYFRPAEVDCLRGDATKAREVLGWSPSIGVKELIHNMVLSDLGAEFRLLFGEKAMKEEL